jgi:hypothetical protein
MQRGTDLRNRKSDFHWSKIAWSPCPGGRTRSSHLAPKSQASHATPSFILATLALTFPVGTIGSHAGGTESGRPAPRSFLGEGERGSALGRGRRISGCGNCRGLPSRDMSHRKAFGPTNADVPAREKGHAGDAFSTAWAGRSIDVRKPKGMITTSEEYQR